MHAGAWDVTIRAQRAPGPADSVTEGVVRRALARWQMEKDVPFIHASSLMFLVRRDAAVEQARFAPQFNAQERKVKTLLRELDGQAVETSEGLHTLTRSKYSRTGYALLPGTHTPAELAARNEVRAWYVGVGVADMWVATALGKDEAKRLALAECVRQGVKPTRKKPLVQRETMQNWQAWLLGEGVVWDFDGPAQRAERHGAARGQEAREMAQLVAMWGDA